MPAETGKEKEIGVSFAPLSIIPAVFVADRLLKLWVVNRFSEGQSFPVWPGVFHLTRVDNTGAAFGIFRGSAMPLTLLSVISVLFLSWYLIRRLSSEETRAGVFPAAAWALVIGGALGNLYDRARFGYVIDLFDLRVWPVFNLADACICCGTFWVAWRFFRAGAKRRA